MEDDLQFQEAVEALRRGDKTRAKDLLTLLLKAEQTNAVYWVWMSASVTSAKERVYCLQTALKLDPENATAKRGLILLGALPPDETVQPFPLNRTRAWEEKLLLAHETPKEKGFRALIKSPALRLAGILIIGVAVIAGAVYGILLPRGTPASQGPVYTAGPSPTFTMTPTSINATGQPTQTFIGPTPLWMLLPATYTPTPMYVNTPRAPQSGDQYRAAKDAYAKGDWDAYIASMELIAKMEPDAADIYYLIGEAYRFKGDASKALENYNHALEINPNFGAAYLGLARGRLLQDPNANVESLFDMAIQLEPNFGEIYLERARYYLYHNEPEDALDDLQIADKLLPNSPEVQLTYANAYVATGDIGKALEYAQKANELDKTSLPSYFLLGRLYVANGDYEKAVEPLSVYVTYEDEDSLAYALLGQCYFELGNFSEAIKDLDKAFKLNPNGLKGYHIYRGLAHLEEGHADEAVYDLEKAYAVDEKSFEVTLGLARAYFLQEKFGNAFLKIEAAKGLAKTKQEIALVHYWRALIQEKRGETKDAIAEWKALLAMDESATTSEMRMDADMHLRSMATPTNTPKAGTRTPTPKVTPTK